MAEAVQRIRDRAHEIQDACNRSADLHGHARMTWEDACADALTVDYDP